MNVRSLAQQARLSFVAAVSVPLLVSAVILAAWVYSDLLDEAEKALDVKSEVAAVHASAYLARHCQMIEQLALSLSLADNLDHWVAGIEAAHGLAPGFLTMLAADSEGIVIAASPADLSRVLTAGPLSIADRDYFRLAPRDPPAFVSDAFEGRGFGSDPIVAISQQFEMSGGRYAVVEGSLDLGELKFVIGDLFRSGSNIEYLLIDGGGRVVATNTDQSLLQVASDTYMSSWTERQLVARSSLTWGAWEVVLIEDRSAVAWQYAGVAAIFFFALVGILLLGLWLYQRQLNPQLVWLTEVAGLLDDIGTERVSLPAVPERASQELAAFERALGLMLKTLHGQRRSLMDHVALLESRVAQRTSQLQARSMALEEFNAIIADPESTPAERRQRVIEMGCRALRLRLGILSRIAEDEYRITHLWSGVHTISTRAGDCYPLASTVCSQAFRLDKSVMAFHDAESRSELMHPAYDGAMPGAYVAARVTPRYSDEGGTLNFSDPDPREKRFAEHEIALVQILANWVATSLDNEFLLHNAQARSRQLQTLTDAIPMLISYTGRDGRYEHVNQNFKLIGADPENVRGQLMSEVLGEEIFAMVAESFQQALDGTVGLSEIVLEQFPDRVFEVRFIPDRLDDEVVGAFGIASDITGFKRREVQLQGLAETDPLTGLVNRRGLARLIEVGLSGSLVVVDLDDFKSVNDTRGHGVGDLVLTHVADQLQAAIRKEDVALRIGGDEFLLIVQGGIAIAEGVARRLHELLNDHPLLVDGEPVRVLASIGIASCDGDFETCLAIADKAAYRAKAAGGNRIDIAR